MYQSGEQIYVEVKSPVCVHESTSLTWNCCGTNLKLRNWKGIHSFQFAWTAENHSYKMKFVDEYTH